MKKVLKKTLHILLAIPMTTLILFFIVYAKSKKNNQPRLVWGPIPIKSWSYASGAMKALGFKSTTLMNNVYQNINNQNDFDLLTTHLFNQFFLFKVIPKKLQTILNEYVVFCYALKNFDIFHLPLSGGFLTNTILHRFEARLLKFANKGIVILPYGADLYRYSLVNNPSLRHALLDSYPNAAKDETVITKTSARWIKHADVIVTSIMIDGLGRWDVLPVNYTTIDAQKWLPLKKYSLANGINEPVVIAHTPNHRTIKGTEFLIQSVEELQKEGFKIKLLLLENIQNEKIREIFQTEVDILVEQFIGNGYALSAIEGMATGLPVLANLSDEWYTRLFRRYSYLNECPILSTTPETIKENLRTLITHANLRKTLGEAGRYYVEKYHSNQAAQYIYGSIYKKIWNNENVNLMNLFHPLKSDYVKHNPIHHPLIENKLSVISQDDKVVTSCEIA